MKRCFLTVMSVALALGLQAQKIQLPEVHMEKAGKMTLMQALQKRGSVREYQEKNIPDDVLSVLLWAACGVNRPEEGRITAPSALNAQDVMLFVCRADGYYRYLANENALEKLGTEDLRPAVGGRQDFVSKAPVCLVMASDLGKFPQPKRELGASDCAYVSENICLASVALGLATVPRASMDTDKLSKAFRLNENQVLFLNNPVGYPKK